MRVGDGQPQRIGRIRAWQCGQAQQALNHGLHLCFASLAMTGHGFFHLQGGVFDHRQWALCQCGNARAARLSQQQGGLRVHVDKHDFNRSHFGFKTFNHFTHA